MRNHEAELIDIAVELQPLPVPEEVAHLLSKPTSFLQKHFACFLILLVS